MLPANPTRTRPCSSNISTVAIFSKPVAWTAGKAPRFVACGEGTARNDTSPISFLPHVTLRAIFAQGETHRKNLQPLAGSDRHRIHGPSTRRNHNRYGGFRSQPVALVARPRLAHSVLFHSQRADAETTAESAKPARRSVSARWHQVGPEEL